MWLFEFVCVKVVEICVLMVCYLMLVYLCVFGLVVCGDDWLDSDIDILVDVFLGMMLFDFGGLMEELKEFLGVKVDFVMMGEVLVFV